MINDNDYPEDEMDFMVQKGYDAGDKFMESLFAKSNNVYDLRGNRIKTPTTPVVLPDNNDPDFIEGFSAGVEDYITSNVVDYHEFILAMKEKFSGAG